MLIRLIGVVFILGMFSCKSEPKKSEAQHIIDENYELHLPSGKTKGLLVIFPGLGLGQSAASILADSDIIQESLKENIACLAMNINNQLFCSYPLYEAVLESIQTLQEKHQIPKGKIAVGGFSAGGNLALTYAANSVKNQMQGIPSAVFAIDPPLDLERFYNINTKIATESRFESNRKEAEFVLRFLNAFLGDQKEKRAAYLENSPFIETAPDSCNARYLGFIPIKLFSEPDLNWYLTERGRTYDQLNAYSISQFHKHLHRIGNKKVDYKPSKNKGIRKDGTRHPHSWSLMDSKETVKWIKKCFRKDK